MIFPRDVFYELVREFEDCHSATGWNIEDNMGDRIRYLLWSVSHRKLENDDVIQVKGLKTSVLVNYFI